jgi:hypothetical protein
MTYHVKVKVNTFFSIISGFKTEPVMFFVYNKG